MKLCIYSDLHLEFGYQGVNPSPDADALILAGDIVNFQDFQPLTNLACNFTGEVLYVAGNHEYYTSTPMDKCNEKCRGWAFRSNTQFLEDRATSIGGINFFGGTMWTDFDGMNPIAMMSAQRAMPDYRLIKNADDTLFTPSDSIDLHEKFKEKLIAWLETEMTGPRVVITHHSPAPNPHTKYFNSPLQPAFNSLDMVPIIEKYQPDLWVIGHTHENVDFYIGKTRIVSNQRGYKREAWECPDFLPSGLLIEI